MPAAPGNQNAAGNSGGKSLNNRVKLATLRGLIVDECIAILSKNKHDLSEKEYEFRNDIILKLAPTVLPRLQEHTSVDGEPLQIFFDPTFNPGKKPDEVKKPEEAKQNDTPPRQAETNSKEPKEI